MSRVAGPTERSATVAAVQTWKTLHAKRLCPYCGATDGPDGMPCPQCGMEDTPTTRQATVRRVGPWFVMQTRNPAAPGMDFSTLIYLARKGKVGPQSVVRGPTTRQLWCFAAHVKGLSREFGFCWGCGGALSSEPGLCPHCNRIQEPPLNPDALLEVRQQAENRRPVYRQVSIEPAAEPPAPEPPPPAARPAPGMLSASELARAFHLGMPPAPAPLPARRRRLSPLKLLLILLVFVLAAAAASIWFDPPLRQRSIDWLTHLRSMWRNQ